MALVVPPPPVENLRRSPRISVRRQISISSPPSSRIAPSLPRTSPIRVRPSSTLRTRPRSRDAYKSRTRVSPHPHPPVSSPASAPEGERPPVRAGTKRKRSPVEPDQPDLPRYELVVAHVRPDGQSQTPRQLRYAKRQRLLSQSGNDTDTRVPSPCQQRVSPPHSPSGQENARAPPQHERLCPPPPEQESSNAESGSPDTSTVTDEDAAASAVDPDAPIFTPLCRLRPLSCRTAQTERDLTLWKTACQERVEHLKRVYNNVYDAIMHAEAEAAARRQPTKALSYTPSEPRHVSDRSNAESSTSANQTQFEFYTPPDVDADGDTDMDSADTSADAGDFDDDDDDDDDDEDDGEYSSGVETPQATYEQVIVLDTPSSAPSASSLPQPTPAPSTYPAVPRLPRLSSIRISNLEPHPPSTRNGVSFIGRGTPADPKRLADWKAPAPPLPSRQRAMEVWTPDSAPMGLFFTQEMVPQPSLPLAPMGASTHEGMQADVDVRMQMQPGFDMSMSMGVNMHMDVDVGVNMHGRLAWLDPSLRAGSLSPSPSGAASPSSPFIHGSHTPNPAFDNSSSSGAGYPFPDVSSARPELGLHPAVAGAGTLSPTGCALHESFLECLRAPDGCACAGPALDACAPSAHPLPSLSLSPSPSPSYSPTPSPPHHSVSAESGMAIGMEMEMGLGMEVGSGGGVGMGMGGAAALPPSAVFPNQELAQFVRSHLVPGSVTLGRALG
ncbi:hypothetical protein BV20DRAFT_982516 [Pilatotrama ljubarskyi]|nr:hypothetical protein BV20DRAFT_982516 [Pilatotrama ljubarskyi]